MTRIYDELHGQGVTLADLVSGVMQGNRVQKSFEGLLWNWKALSGTLKRYWYVLQ